MPTRTRILAYGENGFIRYVIAGCFNTGLGFVVYTGMILIGFNYVAANFIAWLLSIVTSFLLNSRFVFRKPGKHRAFPIFVAFNVFILLFSTTLLTLLIRMFSMNPISASAIVIPVVVAANYCAGKYLVFR